jgi:hypothetical protein
MPVAISQIVDEHRPILYFIVDEMGLPDRLNIDLVPVYKDDSIGLRINGVSETLFDRREIDDGVIRSEFVPRVIKILQGVADGPSATR